nr:MAG TPA: hypothetical protein [Caudoviricetes sp.]
MILGVVTSPKNFLFPIFWGYVMMFYQRKLTLFL